MIRRRRMLIRILGMLTTAGLVGPGCARSGSGVGDVPTMVVSRSDEFVRRVTAEGYLQAVEATPVSAPADAKRPMKIAWVARDGSRVKKGDVVVRFDDSEMQRRLEDSRDDVTTAERQITKERVDGSSSRRKRDRTAGLADAEVSTAREFDIDDEQILSRNEIIESRIDVDVAQAKAKHAHKVKAVERSVTKGKLDLHEIARRKSAAEVDRAKEGLQKLEIRAPNAGILVLERDWMGNTLRVGDSVWRGQKVAELPLVSAMEAELFVLEADAGDLEVGLAAEVVIEAHPDRTHAATIKRVDTLAKPRHRDVPVQYFGVTLELAETDSVTMKVGERVRATILITQGEAIVVPRQAVFETDGKTFVYRQTLTGFEEVEVELGSSSAGRVVIESGLEPDDTIALRDPTKAADELLAPDDETNAPSKSNPGMGG